MQSRPYANAAVSRGHASLRSLPVPAGVKKLNSASRFEASQLAAQPRISAFLLNHILIVVDALYY